MLPYICKFYGGASEEEMETARQVQILDNVVCISYSTNTFGEGMNPTILHSATGK